MKKYILALDEGTTSARAILFDKAGRVVSSSFSTKREEWSLLHIVNFLRSIPVRVG